MEWILDYKILDIIIYVVCYGNLSKLLSSAWNSDIEVFICFLGSF